MNNKGFILIDSLITVIIVSVLCVLCIFIHNTYLNYQEGYVEYKEEVSRKYEDIFNNLGECEKCEILEEETEDM